MRFGPNLYQDGKVCLSLLGTFHAQDESQKWNPKISSLAQILLSIQTQLLTSEPYFNEPGHESMMNTQAGRDGSRRYNSQRRLDTLRHAIIGHIRDPPRGFEEVSRRHFAMCRQRIVAQARRWTLEARGSALEARFNTAYGQLLSLLACGAPSGSESAGDEEPESIASLSPLKEDIAFLAQQDPSFPFNDEEARKPAAVPTSTEDGDRARMAALLTMMLASDNSINQSATVENSTNPWASMGNVESSHFAAPSLPTSSTEEGDDHNDDDEDFYS